MPSDTLDDVEEELEGPVMTDGGKDLDNKLEETRERLNGTKENAYRNISERASSAKETADHPLTYAAVAGSTGGGAYLLSDEAIESAQKFPEAFAETVNAAAQTGEYGFVAGVGAGLSLIALGTGAKAVHDYLEDDREYQE